MDKKAMQHRYEELTEKENDGNLTDEEIEEQIGLFFLLNPDEQHWREADPDLEPEDLFPQVKKWVQP